MVQISITEQSIPFSLFYDLDMLLSPVLLMFCTVGSGSINVLFGLYFLLVVLVQFFSRGLNSRCRFCRFIRGASAPLRWRLRPGSLAFTCASHL